MMMRWEWDASSSYLPYSDEDQALLNAGFASGGDSMYISLQIGDAKEVIVRKHPRRGWIQERADNPELWRAVRKRGVSQPDVPSPSISLDSDEEPEKNSGVHRDRTEAEAHLFRAIESVKQRGVEARQVVEEPRGRWIIQLRVSTAGPNAINAGKAVRQLLVTSPDGSKHNSVVKVERWLGLAEGSLPEKKRKGREGTSGASGSGGAATGRDPTEGEREVCALIKAVRQQGIAARRVTEEGWAVELKVWTKQRGAHIGNLSRTLQVTSPDGTRFDSLVKVERHLGLTPSRKGGVAGPGKRHQGAGKHGFGSSSSAATDDDDCLFSDEWDSDATVGDDDALHDSHIDKNGSDAAFGEQEVTSTTHMDEGWACTHEAPTAVSTGAVAGTGVAVRVKGPGGSTDLFIEGLD
jgi:hypothetical protein